MRPSIQLIRRNILLLPGMRLLPGYYHQCSITRQITTSSSVCYSSADLNPSSSNSRNRDQVSIVPHPVSKLRLFNPSQSTPRETVRERALREKRIEIQAWNHQYWCQNNAEFNRLKKDFIKHELKSREEKENANELLSNTNQSHEELALFYKRFLDANQRKHISYNFEWYKRNLSLLWPSLMVQLERLLRRK